MIKWIKNLFNKKPDNHVSVKEVKQIYKDFSKNQLIRVIINLANQNAALKLKGKVK